MTDINNNVTTKKVSDLSPEEKLHLEYTVRRASEKNKREMAVWEMNRRLFHYRGQ